MINTKEAIEEILTEYGVTFTDALAERLMKEIAPAEKVSRSENPNKWIPVSDRLPEIHQDILLSLRSLDIEVGFRGEKEPYFYCHGAYIEPQNVLAWMPLPEPYMAESEE